MRLILLMLAAAVSSVARGATAPLSTRQIAADVTKATVSIRVALTGNEVSSGTGFITDSSGTVVTNFHVVEGAQKIEVRLANGDTYEVTGVRAVDARRDIAVLQVPGFKLPVVQLGDSDTLAAGDQLVVIGNALGGLDNTVTTGVVSAIREVEGNRFIQMSAAASPGNSGGPVVNDHGEVIGITRFKLTGGENLNFAIPINFARGFLQQPTQQGLGAIAAAKGGSLFAESGAALAAGFPRRWHSLTTGNSFRMTISDDVMLVERELPDQLKSVGARNWTELKKNGDQWVGTNHSMVPCTYQPPFAMTRTTKVCSFETPFSITLLSKIKVQGTAFRTAPGAELNCRKCEWDPEPGTSEFTWIPGDN